MDDINLVNTRPVFNPATGLYKDKPYPINTSSRGAALLDQERFAGADGASRQVTHEDDSSNTAFDDIGSCVTFTDGSSIDRGSERGSDRSSLGGCGGGGDGLAGRRVDDRRVDDCRVNNRCRIDRHFDGRNDREFDDRRGRRVDFDGFDVVEVDDSQGQGYVPVGMARPHQRPLQRHAPISLTYPLAGSRHTGRATPCSGAAWRLS
eukprot:4523402-Pleurochrysis_carterae.AAC.1